MARTAGPGRVGRREVSYKLSAWGRGRNPPGGAATDGPPLSTPGACDRVHGPGFETPPPRPSPATAG